MCITLRSCQRIALCNLRQCTSTAWTASRLLRGDRCLFPFRPMSSFTSSIDAEPLERYREGGYHPVHLGDLFKQGRYKIIHKLGWGGYATVWLASDTAFDTHVALKVTVAEGGTGIHESDVLRHLSTAGPDHPGYMHIPHLLDSFELLGPNGRHQCLVTELLGPTVASVAETFMSGRLPGRLAWEISRQTATALEYIHDASVAHGDLHPGNIAFTVKNAVIMSTSDIMQSLGSPEIGYISSADGSPSTKSFPLYLVAPVSLSLDLNDEINWSVKVIDFGQSFRHGQQLEVHCPLVYRAPETILTSHWDHRIDIWSLACVLFEFIVGYPPFDNVMPNEKDLLLEWKSMFGVWPTEWERQCPRGDASAELDDTYSISTWLQETYFDDGKTPFFTYTNLQTLSELLRSMMNYRPHSRPSVSDILRYPWFDHNPVEARNRSQSGASLL